MRYIALALILLTVSGLFAVCDTLYLCSDWNLISVSVVISGTLDSLFEGIIIYDMIGGSFIPMTDTLIPGKGYVAYPVTDTVLVFCGPPLDELPVTEIKSGWNLIGSNWEGWIYADLITVPPGIIDTTEPPRKYECGGDYFSEDTVYHGQGALVFAVDSGNVTTAIEENSPSAKPEAIEIFASPNPFNGAVRIEAPSAAKIEIYDVNGRRIDDIARRVQPDEAISPNQGDCRALRARNDGGAVFVWRPGESLGSGVYLVRATEGKETISKRIIYLK